TRERWLPDLVGNRAEEPDDAAHPVVGGELDVSHAAEGGPAGRVDDRPLEPGPVPEMVDIAGATVDPVRALAVHPFDVRAGLVGAASLGAPVDVVAVLGPDLVDHRAAHGRIRFVPGRHVLVD